MSEDTSGNPGVTWPQPEAAVEVVRRMQIKLHRWASEDSARRFDDLHNLVYDPAFLVLAFARVAGNADREHLGWIGSPWPRSGPRSG
jgi:RNA-directed DNA polymerase